MAGTRNEASLSQTRQENVYLAIQQVQQEKGFRIQLLCQIAGIPRSSYYKWMKRTPLCREAGNVQLTEAMVELYEKVGRIYGYRRLTLNLRRQTGQVISRKRILRLMRMAGIQSVIRRKKKKYPHSTLQHVAENLLNRKFQADAPNHKWVTDVTEFKYGNGQKAYLSAILDLHDNSILSYVVGHANNNELVFETLRQALQAVPASTPLLHSDRGFQYTFLSFKRCSNRDNSFRACLVSADVSITDRWSLFGVR